MASAMMPSHGGAVDSVRSVDTSLYVTSGLALWASLPSVIVLLIGFPIVRRLRLDRLDVALVAAGLAGLTVLIAVFAGNLGEWYVD
jgi:hypothetical protein